MENQYIEINTNGIESPRVGDNLFQNRAALAAMHGKDDPEVSIIIQAYNRLEKTKRCVESVLKYTTDVSYELLLIDNGSEDKTLDYFQSVDYPKKKIIRITKNLCAPYPAQTIKLSDLKRFILMLSDDQIVTHNWLTNLLRCIKSDERIGMVTPVSNNVSNLQCVDIPYSSYDEMQRKAREFNVSNPRKWEDRLRLMTVSTLFRKEVFLGMGWPYFDCGFFHDFADDDITFAIRRLGYRAVLAGDTWICHDHDLQHGEGKNPTEFQRSLNIGRQNFRDKYFGVDAWDDVNNYLIPYLDCFPAPHVKGSACVLGIDTRCGTPILDIKNWLRQSNVFDTTLSAFTQDAKYWVDLKTICQGAVICDREEFLLDSFPREFFDYIVVDRPFNRYHEPLKFLKDLFTLCKSGGYVICRLKNTATFQEYVNMLGKREVYDAEISYNIPLEVADNALKRFGSIEKLVPIQFNMGRETQEAIAELLPQDMQQTDKAELLFRMICREFLFVVRKK